MGFIRIFDRVGEEADLTGQLFCCKDAYEKKEVANIKIKADATINAQLQKLYSEYGVTNGRQLCYHFYKRLSELGISMDYKPQVRSFIACGLLFAFSLSVFNDNDYRRMRRIRMRRTETELIIDSTYDM